MFYLQNNAFVTYNAGYLYWEYTYLQKIQLLSTLQASYTTNNTILYLLILLAEYKVTYNMLYEILTV